jgi:hypothetical protein
MRLFFTFTSDNSENILSKHIKDAFMTTTKLDAEQMVNLGCSYCDDDVKVQVSAAFDPTSLQCNADPRESVWMPVLDTLSLYRKECSNLDDLLENIDDCLAKVAAFEANPIDSTASAAALDASLQILGVTATRASEGYTALPAALDASLHILGVTAIRVRKGYRALDALGISDIMGSITGLDPQVDSIPPFPSEALVSAVANISTANPSNTEFLSDSKHGALEIRRFLNQKIEETYFATVKTPFEDACEVGRVSSFLVKSALKVVEVEEEVEEFTGKDEIRGRQIVLVEAGQLFAKKLSPFFTDISANVSDAFETLGRDVSTQTGLKNLKESLQTSAEICDFSVLRLLNYYSMARMPPRVLPSTVWEFTYKTEVLSQSAIARLHHAEPDFMLHGTIYMPFSKPFVEIPADRFVPLLKDLFPTWRVEEDISSRRGAGSVKVPVKDEEDSFSEFTGRFESALHLPKGYVNRRTQFLRLFGTRDDAVGNVIGRSAFELANICEALDARQLNTVIVSKMLGHFRFMEGDALIALVSVKRGDLAPNDEDGDCAFTIGYQVSFERPGKFWGKSKIR